MRKVNSKWIWWGVLGGVVGCLGCIILVELVVLLTPLPKLPATLAPVAVFVVTDTPLPPTQPPVEPTSTLPEPAATAALSSTVVPPLTAEAPPLELTPAPATTETVATLAPGPALGQHVYFSGTLGYLLYLPPDYGQDPQKAWPLVLFLHGVGERGHNPELVTAQGLPKLASQGKNFDFILVSPQCPLGGYWSDLFPSLIDLLDNLQATYHVDPHRVYLTGTSMGGYGALGLAQAYPDRFAALAPIAGGYFWDPNIPAAGHYSRDLNAAIPQEVCVLKNMPAWFFHGEADTVVPFSQSQHVVEALKACGAQPEPKLTLYPGAGHVRSWELAYAEPEFYTWLLSQSR